MPRLSNAVVALLACTLALFSTVTAAAAGSAAQADVTLNQLVQTRLYPQLDYFFEKLKAEKAEIVVDGVPAFKTKDKFLPGKIAVGLSDLVLATPSDSKRVASYLAGYRDIADLTVGMDIDTWGIYYYLLALQKLQRAGLLEQAVSATTLAQLKQKLDWRKFVTQPDFNLINLPTNYYGVAFSIARLRYLLGWEDDAASKKLLDKMLKHYETYSGKFGFSDETDGEGRFDRYSILLIAEICQRFVETGLTVTPELKALLRKSADIALNVGNTAGDGFSFGRSIGTYGDTAIMEILSISAYLDVLTPEEKRYAYTYVTRIAAKYADFWFDPAMHSVDMWGKGRRTDSYRGKHRILGENFSLVHQFISSNELWNKSGFENKAPQADLGAWLDKTQPTFNLRWFARGEYDRALAIYRDRQHVFSLLLVNGGAGQHDNSPYYPLPFSGSIIAGTPDSGAAHPQLLPKFTLADGAQLIGTAFIKDIDSGQAGKQYRVSYRQDEMTRLGKNVPVKDSRITLKTQYTLEPGLITRTDTYTPAAPLEIEKVTLDFASFSDRARIEGNTVRFGEGAVQEFSVSGLKSCRVENTVDGDEYRSPAGAMKTHVSCSSDRFSLKDPLTIRWVMKYQ